MILKPWAEVPVSRHLLDENDDINDAEAGFLLKYEPWTTVSLTDTKIHSETLVVAMSRLEPYFERLVANGSSKVIGRVSTGIRRVDRPIDPEKPLPRSEMYEPGEDEEDATTEDSPSSETVHELEIVAVTNEKGAQLSLVIVPPILPAHCYTFSTELLAALKPANVVVVAPGAMSTTSAHVYGLLSSNAPAEWQSLLPALEPPFMLTGVAASLLAHAESSKIAAAGIVVRAEGPEGHEVIFHDAAAADIVGAVSRLLSLDPASLSPHHISDHGLYI